MIPMTVVIISTTTTTAATVPETSLELSGPGAIVANVSKLKVNN